MMSHQHRKTQGFTLLELSIVLVIIGLIIGGILVGQSMIKSSELNSVIVDRTRYITAMVSFKNKYFGLPGDIKNATDFWGAADSCPNSVATTGTCNGDGDGRVIISSWTDGVEHYRFWQQLSLSGMISGQYSGMPATNVTATVFNPGKNLPQAKVGGVFTIFYNTSPLAGQVPKHEMRSYGSSPYAGSLQASDMYEIDSKADDGKPGKGAFVADFSFYPNCVTTNDPNTAEYKITDTAYRECLIRMDMD